MTILNNVSQIREWEFIGNLHYKPCLEHFHLCFGITYNFQTHLQSIVLIPLEISTELIHFGPPFIHLNYFGEYDYCGSLNSTGTYTFSYHKLFWCHRGAHWAWRRTWNRTAPAGTGAWSRTALRGSSVGGLLRRCSDVLLRRHSCEVAHPSPSRAARSSLLGAWFVGASPDSGPSHHARTAYRSFSTAHTAPLPCWRQRYAAPPVRRRAGPWRLTARAAPPPARTKAALDRLAAALTSGPQTRLAAWPAATCRCPSGEESTILLFKFILIIIPDLYIFGFRPTYFWFWTIT
jgi:hypothetical protein